MTKILPAQHIINNSGKATRLVQCIQCHNEEDLIQHTMRSIYDEVDKIIVIEGAVVARPNRTEDGHSTDKTVERIQEFIEEEDVDKKVLFIQNTRPFIDLEEMKNTFLHHVEEGDWLVINDCLPGHRCVPVRITGMVDVMSLEDIFEHYLSQGYQITQRGNKEVIYVDDLETLSATEVKTPEHQLYRDQRGAVLDDYFKSKLNRNHLNVVDGFESGDIIFPDSNATQCTIAKQARSKISALKNVVGKWCKVKCISRNKTNKNIMRISQKYGEVECTSDHRVARISNDKIDYHTIDNFDKMEPLVQLGEIPCDNALRNCITLSEILNLDDAKISFMDNILYYKSPYKKHRIHSIRDCFSHAELEKFCALLGYYVAEGSIAADKDWRICGKKKHVDQYASYLDSMANYTYKDGFSAKKNGSKVYYRNTSCKIIIEIFKALCGIGSSGKRVPAFIFNLDNKYKRAFLRGYNDGDSHLNGFDKNISTTVSIRLAAGVCLLQKQLGEDYSLSYRSQSGYSDNFNHQRNYSIYQNVQKPKSSFKSKVQNLGKTNQYVYDLTVPETNNFCDALGMICVHNCDEFYRPEDIRRIRDLTYIYPDAREFVPLFLHFYRDVKHIKKPDEENQPQHQRIIKYTHGMHWKSHPVMTYPEGFCSYFTPEIQPMRRVLNDMYVWHLGFVKSDDEVRSKAEFYEQELAKHGDRGVEAHNEKTTEFLTFTEDLNTIARYDGYLPEEVKVLNTPDAEFYTDKEFDNWLTIEPYNLEKVPQIWVLTKTGQWNNQSYQVAQAWNYNNND